MLGMQRDEPSHTHCSKHGDNRSKLVLHDVHLSLAIPLHFFSKQSFPLSNKTVFYTEKKWTLETQHSVQRLENREEHSAHNKWSSRGEKKNGTMLICGFYGVIMYKMTSNRLSVQTQALFFGVFTARKYDT